MSKHGEIAERLFREEQYNCAQAVFVAFCDVTGLEPETARRLASSFGGGLGRLREVCGALSGAAMAAGYLWGGYDVTVPEGKKAHYARIQELARRFREGNGDILCRNLLELSETEPTDPTPEPRTPAYYAGRKCADFVRVAAEALDSMIEEYEKN